MRVIKTLFSLGVKSLGALFFNFALLRHYGVAIHSNVILTISFVMGLAVFVRFGLDQTIFRFAGYAFRANNYTRTRQFYYSTLLFILLANLIVILFIKLNGDMYGVSAIDVLILLPVISISFIVSAWFKVIDKSEWAYLFEFGSLLFAVSTLMFFHEELKLNIDIISLIVAVGLIVASIGLSYVAIFLNICVNSEKNIQKREAIEWKNILRSMPLYCLNNFFTYFQQWGILVFIAVILNEQSVSNFSIFLRIATVFNLVLVVMDGYLSPRFSYEYFEEGPEQLNKTLKQYHRPLVLVSLIGLLFLILVYPIFASYTNLNNANELIYVYGILMCAFAFNVLSGPAMACLSMLGGAKFLLVMRLLTLLTFIVSVLLIKDITIIIFTIMFSAYVVIQKLLASYSLRKTYGIKSSVLF